MANETETVTFKLPSGEEVDLVVPIGMSDDELTTFARGKRPDLFGLPPGTFQRGPGAPLEFGGRMVGPEDIPRPRPILTPEGPVAAPFESTARPISLTPREEREAGRFAVRTLLSSAAAIPTAGLGVPGTFAALYAPAAAGGLAAGVGELITGGPSSQDVAREVLLGSAAGAVGGVAGIPSRKRAGELLDIVAKVTNKVPVDVTEAGNAALRAKSLADAGAQLPKVINRFIQRVTDPAKGPLTFEEARLFEQNASRLTVQELTNLKPAMRKLVTEFLVGLRKGTIDAAAKVGQSSSFTRALSEYHRASLLDETLSPGGIISFLVRTVLPKSIRRLTR